MSLPSGYSKIDYIEATGTQYINTYFTPDGNSRIVMDFESAAVSSTVALFGARTASSENVFGMWLDAGKAQPQYGSVSYATKPIAITNTVRQTYELNKGVATVGGTSVTFDNLSFSAGQPLMLFAMNSGGSVDGRRASGKLYSCKIYNNGTLVRDFVPCKADGGELGLFDLVESVFYGNSGTGTLKTGNKHKTLIGGTGYEIKSGRTLIGGTGYDIKKGRTLIDGTGYDIGFGPRPVGELAVRSSVYTNVNGLRTEFLVVHQGKPSSLYDDSCNGTWLLMKNIFATMAWNGPDNNNSYKASTIRTYLNSTLLKLFDSDIQGVIKSVKIPYVNGTGSGGTTATGANGLSTKIFLLSAYEVGYTQSYDKSLPIDGAKLDYFMSGTSTDANNMRIGYLSGSATRWWLRSPMTSDEYWVSYIYITGALTAYNSSTSNNGIRPALVVPSNLLVSSDGSISTNTIIST